MLSDYTPLFLQLRNSDERKSTHLLLSFLNTDCTRRQMSAIKKIWGILSGDSYDTDCQTRVFPLIVSKAHMELVNWRWNKTGRNILRFTRVIEKAVRDSCISQSVFYLFYFHWSRWFAAPNFCHGFYPLMKSSHYFSKPSCRSPCIQRVDYSDGVLSKVRIFATGKSLFCIILRFPRSSFGPAPG